MARWGTAVPKAVHQGLAPCGRGSCPRSAPRKPLPLLILTVIDTGPRAPLLRRAAPQLHYKNGCQWNPAKSLLRESGRLFGNYTKGPLRAPVVSGDPVAHNGISYVVLVSAYRTAQGLPPLRCKNLKPPRIAVRGGFAYWASLPSFSICDCMAARADCMKFSIEAPCRSAT